MYVDVYVGGIYFKIDKIWHDIALRHESVVGSHHGFVEIGMLHVAAVDKEIFVNTLLSRCFGLAHETVDAAQCGFNADREYLLIEAFAEHVGYALTQTAGAQAHEFGAVAVESELYVGIDQHYTLVGRHDIVQLGGVCLEKLASGGNVEKEVFHKKIAANGTRNGFLAGDTRPSDGHESANLAGGSTGAQFHLCHCGDRGQRFTTETHGMKGEKVVGLAYL